MVDSIAFHSFLKILKPDISKNLKFFFDWAPKHGTCAFRKRALLIAFAGEADSSPVESASLRRLFDFENDHAARLIVHQRLRMVAIAGVHPHTLGCDPAMAGPRFLDCAGKQRAA